MHDEADVRLVDAQAERAGRDHQPDLARHEAPLRVLAVGGAQLAVVPAGVDALAAQPAPELLHLADSRGIHDAAARLFAEDPQQSLPLGLAVHGAANLEPQVGALDPGVHHPRIGDAQLAHDVLRHLRRGCGGEGQHRRTAQRADRLGEREVGGAEIVAPLRDAVRLVDDEQADPARAQRLDVLGILQALGGQVDEVVGSRLDLLDLFALLAGAQCRVELRHADARHLGLALLVLHQRDQRRDDHHGAWQEHRRDLVGEGLPSAGRQDPERVLARQCGLDQLALAGAEARHPESPGGLAANIVPVHPRKVGLRYSNRSASIGSRREARRAG